MPTVITHSIFAISLAHLSKNSELPGRFWTLAIVCSLLPDLDVIGFRFGIAYADAWGHRGLSHSLSFALLTGLLVVLIFFWQTRLRSLRVRLVVFYFAVTASHGVFDALTNGGLGIAFFAPFDDTRYFFPFQPIEVSPIGLKNFLTERGMDVLLSETLWLILPSFIFMMLVSMIRRIIRKDL
ncbi:hypothetical protein MNBD_GAMMA21-2082 [hydrothermal vent metagenome]|uniref:Inner membrane protein YbcI n=1 Tax=hydrothermal vent metagenome TaxID=652676 RepID=A0A3B1ABB9_9ZZZZ